MTIRSYDFYANEKYLSSHDRNILSCRFLLNARFIFLKICGLKKVKNYKNFCDVQAKEKSHNFWAKFLANMYS